MNKLGISTNWFESSDLKSMHRFIEEGRKQLDISLLIKKMQYSEKLGEAVLENCQRKALLLSEPFTLEKA